MSMPDVFIASDALDGETCRWVQASMDVGSRAAAGILHDAIDAVEEGRQATDVDVPDEVIAAIESRLDAHRDAVASFFGVRLRGREGAGFLRYESGGSYGPHVDRADVPSWPDAARRAITIVVFLNSSRDADPHGDFAGGCLRLFPDGLAAPAVDLVSKRGMLVAFAASIPHEVTLVTCGTRDTVVDWYY